MRILFIPCISNPPLRPPFRSLNLTGLVAAGVPTALVAARWLLPLCAQSLPPPTLYRLWDLLLLERSSKPLLAGKEVRTAFFDNNMGGCLSC